MPVHSATHPVVAHKMTRLRDVRTNGTDFRRLLKELTFYLGYEATRDSKLVPDVVTTPMNISHNGSKIGEKVAIVPILRAGLAMTDAMLELIPSASVHHIGNTNDMKFLLQ